MSENINNRSKGSQHGSDEAIQPANKEQRKEEVSWKIFFIWTLVFILIFGAFVCLDLAYEKPLYKETQKFLPDIQDKNSFMDYFMVIIGELGESFGIIATCWIAANILPFSESCFLLISVGACLYINGILKILYHAPRPFFDTPKIEALSCSTSYGNPSGHAMYFSFPFPLVFILLFRSQIKQKKYILPAIFGALTIAICGLALFGRIYLGVHSVDQVIYGCTLGLTLLVYFVFVLYKPLMGYIHMFTRRKCSRNEMIVHLSINLLMVLLVLTTIAVIAYVLNITTHDDPSEWNTAVELKCSKSNLKENSIFVRKALRNIFAPIGIFGCFGGIILYSYYAPTIVDKYLNNNVWVVLGRLGVSLLCMLPFVPLLLIPSSAPFVVLLIFAELLMSFSFTIVLYFLGRLLMVKIKLFTPVKDVEAEIEMSDNKVEASH
ncbi:unnamed protein product [Moneuplotes crassus]|uniref:Phosphatidic acid phosphatase type 2/haloperoxidase domain-containing protein n=1 Tax=Euplotes crassus TaxID=5936 RepID=A0AAD1UIL7_EUPCR|nr:unnamed protein product [Moneuplotes crassus]